MHRKKVKIINVVGARPNFMKIAPIIKVMKNKEKIFDYILVHTGQHYDKEMSNLFFNELKIPKPDKNLRVGSGSHAWQTAEIMRRFEPVVINFKPDYILVAGDVNSTIACSLVAKKLGIKVIHIEAGLRSFDMEMPEEINRILTDRISNLLFTHSLEADKNLLKEGIPKKNIHLVGNVMIDTLKSHELKANKMNMLKKLDLKAREYFIVTLHRPSNVDHKKNLKKIINTLIKISKKKKIVFPIHPRSRKKLAEYKLLKSAKKHMILLKPLGYLKFLNLISNAIGVLTDSGGIQEETTILGIPCITLRTTTERPVTVTSGTNTITGLNRIKILKVVKNIINGKKYAKITPPLWDGKASERIVNIIIKEASRL